MFSMCCLPDCNSERQDVMLHKMPRNSERLSLWISVINQAVPSANFGDLETSDIKKLLVCHKHFEMKYITPKMRLTYNACPTLFTATEIESGTATKTYPELESTLSNQNKDHTYSRKRRYDHTYAKKEHTSRHNISELPLMNPSIQIGGCSASTDSPEQQKAVSAGLPSMNSSIGIGGCSASTDSPVQQKAVSTELPSMNPSIRIGGCSASTDSPVQQKAVSAGVPRPSAVFQTKRRKTKIMLNIKNMSPECREMYDHYRIARKQLNYRVRAKMALKVSKQETFQKLTENMNPIAQKFLWMQIKLCTKNKKGRRFSLEEKVIALSIQKQSPKCYRFLQRIFILPSKTTLNKLLENVTIEAGINMQIFNVIKREVSDWTEAKKLCTIIFDEMKLDTGLHYLKKQDKINGFVELTGKTSRFADHALTFVIKGAVHKWQQPIAFYFSEGAASGPEVKGIIKEIVAAVCDTGLQPIALVSDQGSSFQSAFKSLQEDTRRGQIIAGEEPDDTIHLNGQCLSIIYDPPHLIKGIRNNFLTKNISMGGKICTWQDLVDVYKTDCRHAQARLLHKLNDEHIIPEKIKKMKVKNCVRVFSKTMAAALSYTASFSQYADGAAVSTSLADTAELVSFLDDLFDSVNGASTLHKNTRGKKLRSAVTEKSPHHEFWNEALKTLKNINFVDQNGKLTSVPSLKNWMITLRSYQRLWQVLNKKNIKIMRPRYFNSDTIENFFGRVRSYNARNVDPTCHAFVCTFKSLMVTNLIKFHEKTYNCEDDSTQGMIKVQSLFTSDHSNVMDSSGNLSASAAPSTSVERERDADAENIRVQAARERLDVHSRAYTAGWVIRKLLSKYNCDKCKKDFTSSDETNIHKWITYREYKTIKQKKLIYPAEYALRSFTNIVMESNEYLENNAHKEKVIQSIKLNSMTKCSFDFIQCDLHRDSTLEYFLKVSITLCVFNWCNIINKILKGTDVDRLLGRKKLPHMQAQALEKFKKKLKNKSLYK